MKQLCLQCLVEGICTGASNFEWMYSFPKSFTQGQLNQYKTLWTNSLNDTMNEACTLNSLVLQPMSESESVAEYFSDSMDASFNRGIICVDIGGGSSDIAIWQGKKDSLVNQTSIRLLAEISSMNISGIGRRTSILFSHSSRMMTMISMHP